MAPTSVVQRGGAFEGAQSV